MHAPVQRSDVSGASLVGLLMIVVVLGGLAALGVVGVSNLNDSSDAIAVVAPATTVARTATTVVRAEPGAGAGRGVACVASADAARAATAVFFVNSGGAYPTKWTDLTVAKEPMLSLPPGVTVDAANPNQLDGYGWKMVMAGGGATAPTFTCQAATT